MDWKQCNDKRLVKRINIDNNLIQSLLKESEKKYISCNRLLLDDTSASSKVSLAYDSIRELLEALAIKKGCKIYNHECYCSFLKEIIKNSQAGAYFDEFRIIKNGINYYGEELNEKEAKVILERIVALREKIKIYLKE